MSGWEDYAIALAVLVLTVTVIPMIKSHFTPPVATSGPMVGAMFVLLISYISLGLWFSVAIETLSLVLWGILFIRGLKEKSCESSSTTTATTVPAR